RLRVRLIVLLQEKEGQSVVCTGQRGLQLERAAVAADRLVQLTGTRVGDRRVLEHALIVRLVAQGEPVGGQRSRVITLALQRERLVQVVDTLRSGLARGLPAGEAAPPGHARRVGAKATKDGRHRSRRTEPKFY